eukprot:COSAG05_NODE_82_length_20915_cov_5.306399_8_plen_65_part_00
MPNIRNIVVLVWSVVGRSRSISDTRSIYSMILARQYSTQSITDRPALWCQRIMGHGSVSINTYV